MKEWRPLAVPGICERMLGFSVPQDNMVLIVSYEGTHLLHLGTPVTVSDYTQLRGLAFDQKVRQMRAILTEVQATRTPQQLTRFGPFTWEEAIGPSAEVVFIGQGAPPSTQRATVVVIKRNGQVFRMLPTGLSGIISPGPPKQISYDLQRGQAQLMATC